jgi:hypothetical protein
MIKCFLPILLALALSSPTAQGDATTRPAWQVGEVLHEGPFEPGLPRWHAEIESAETAGVLEAVDGKLRVDVPLGATVWFEPELQAPLRISYTVTPISAGGLNDEVRDLNCFWMATDPRAGGGGGGDFFDIDERTGKFNTYHQLRCYYAGIGGSRNTTTRFRRYIGDPEERPLLPEHDLGEGHLLEPNVFVHIELIVIDDLVQMRRDGKVLFELIDPDPYHHGRFGFRTVKNHMLVEDFQVHRLVKP